MQELEVHAAAALEFALLFGAALASNAVVVTVHVWRDHKRNAQQRDLGEWRTGKGYL
jgi:hypothetical protein